MLSSTLLFELSNNTEQIILEKSDLNQDVVLVAIEAVTIGYWNGCSRDIFNSSVNIKTHLEKQLRLFKQYVFDTSPESQILDLIQRID